MSHSTEHFREHWAHAEQACDPNRSSGSKGFHDQRTKSHSAMTKMWLASCEKRAHAHGHMLDSAAVLDVVVAFKSGGLWLRCRDGM